MDVKDEIREFVVQNFLFGDGSTLFDATSFLENGIIDSTGILEVVNFIEKKYGVKVEDIELLPENLDSIDNIAHFLAGKKSGKV